MTASFDAVMRGFGNSAGIEVPPDVLDQLGGGKRPRVRVQIGDYRFALTVGPTLIGLSKAHREASGLQARHAVHVELDLDTEPAEIEVPADLAAALAGAGLSDTFAQLARSRRKEYARQISAAKAEPAKQRRLVKFVADLS